MNAPSLDEVARLPEGSLSLSFLSPLLALDVVRALNERKITLPHSTCCRASRRAQYMDALSSQATVSGYRAALAGATYLDRFFPLLTTAAGTIRPAKVLVMGVGVAGLQAIATAKRLGARVRAYDVRTAAKEEAESAGATFVQLGVTADAAGGYARELTPEEREQQQQALTGEVAALRRRDHDRGRTRAQGADTRHDPDGRGHGRRFAHHRHGGRWRRQHASSRRRAKWSSTKACASSG